MTWTTTRTSGTTWSPYTRSAPRPTASSCCAGRRRRNTASQKHRSSFLKCGQSFPKDLAVWVSDFDGTDTDRRSPASKPYGTFRESLVAEIINECLVDVTTKMIVADVDQ